MCCVYSLDVWCSAELEAEERAWRREKSMSQQAEDARQRVHTRLILDSPYFLFSYSSVRIVLRLSLSLALHHRCHCCLLHVDSGCHGTTSGIGRNPRNRRRIGTQATTGGANKPSGVHAVTRTVSCCLPNHALHVTWVTLTRSKGCRAIINRTQSDSAYLTIVGL